MKVKIKTWKQMEGEYGLYSFGSIKTEYTFTPGMEEDMPEDRIIEVDEDDNWNGWYIDNDMIDSVIVETKVKIKTWQQMESEYGLNNNGNINCHFTFTAKMEEKMPDDRIIEIDARSHWLLWEISKDMIEEVIK